VNDTNRVLAKVINNKTWVKYSLTFTADAEKNSIQFGQRGPGNIEICGMKLELGNVPTDWSLAMEDIQSQLDEKANQKLTNQQLTALTEKAQLHDAELKAKATMEQLSNLEKAYEGRMKANEEAIKKSEADLILAASRIEATIQELGGLRELKKFVDSYMSSSNEGLIIGKNDGSSTIKVSSDRISMFSAGKEVMYLTQGVIHIDNGIFTQSIQVGRFRTEQYSFNPDMNVIRYVG
jgi:phage minor structural protein